jgi:KRAB domain-containing zinc finger protein
VSVKVELMEHPEELPLKEEPIRQNEEDPISSRKTFNFSCDLCDKYLSTNEALAIHKIIHAEMTKYKCEIEECSLDFANRKSMLQHMRVDHGIEKTPDSRVFHMCPVCQKQFPTKSAMQDHQINHSDQKNFVCMECGKQFKRKESLHFHMKKHAGIEDYHCDQCAARYVSSSAFVAHKLAKHTDPADKETFLCNFCGQSFNKKEYLAKHLTKHTGGKPYQCKECGKSFRLYGVYKNHLRVHRGIKDYKCAHCEKMFMQRQHLVVHERRHTGDKRHKCEECGKAFVEPATLRNHLKTHQNLSINQYIINQ